jgi:zinc transport system substrate-binding protein
MLAHDHKTHDHEHHHAHAHHAHDHEAEAAQQIYKGYFEDAQIADRPLADWAGTWQSVYPYLQDGTLAPVMAAKAQSSDKTAADYTAYYETGYKTDVARVEINSRGAFIFRKTNGTSFSGSYISDGFKVLTYSKGNRGVRFIFKKTFGDNDAPAYIQFSDHRIAPSKSDHYHLYWGNDRAALLEEVTHWPTFYPAGMSGAEILQEMLAHR